MSNSKNNFLKTMSKFRDSIPGAIIILAIICLVATLGLSATHRLTKDIIAAGQAATETSLFKELVPEVSSFEPLTGDFPEGISQSVKADTGEIGFSVTTKGYGGDVTFVVIYNPDGTYNAISMASNNETLGIGSKVGEPDHLSKFVGESDPQSVDAISGATVTSDALESALKTTNEAFSMAS